MKTIHTVLSVIAIGVASSAFAGGGPYPVDELPTAGPGKSRAEVIAEFKEAQRLGAGAYVKKPYVMEHIGMAIRSALNRSEAPIG